MMFITPRGDRKCLVFLREDKENKSKQVKYRQKSIKQGNIVVKIYTDHLHRDRDMSDTPIDLMLRYENVHDQLNNLFADFNDTCSARDMYLYVCGYLDNKIRIFELNQRTAGPVHVIDDHQARVTCIKFSKDYQFLITCDARGVIHHYQRNCHRGEEASMNFESNPCNAQSDREERKTSS